MQPRFTRAEYWILELVVQSGNQLAWLDPEKEIEQMYNKPSHGLDRLGLVTTLDGLFRAGLIRCEINEEELPADQLRREFLWSALDDPRPCYWLTAKGGAMWEAFAKPDWERFVQEERDFESGLTTLTCPDRKWLQWYLTDFMELNAVLEEDWSDMRDTGTWQATYWKTLPQGWQVSLLRPWKEPVFASFEDSVKWSRLSLDLSQRASSWYRWC